MLLRVLVASLLCLSAYATADRVSTRSSEDITTAADKASWLSDSSSETDSSDQRWYARHRSTASITEPGWSPQLQDAEPAVGSRHNGFFVLDRARVPKRPAPYQPYHLLDIPLLI